MARGVGRLLLLSVALREATRAQPASVVPETMSFEEYKATFEKIYRDQADEQGRRRAFEENLRVIAELNAKNDAGEHSFRCGVNFFHRPVARRVPQPLPGLGRGDGGVERVVSFLA